MNPGTVLPIYELSKPAPSTTWVFLHSEIIVALFLQKRNVFIILKIDLRIMSSTTKNKLANAYKELASKKDLNKITISDITDLCGVNRQTFYYHFHDIYDLIKWTFTDIAEQAFKGNVTVDTWQAGMENICRVMLEDKEFLTRAFHSSYRECLDRIVFTIAFEISGEIIKNETKDESCYKNSAKELVAMYYGNACGGMLLNWMRTDMKESPEEIAEVLTELTFPNLFETLKKIQS